MVILPRLLLTAQELQLLKAVDAVVFGEVTDVEIKSGTDPQYNFEVTEKQAWLINLIRNGTQHFDTIQVHNSEPTQVEITSEVDGFKCRKKIRPEN